MRQCCEVLSTSSEEILISEASYMHSPQTSRCQIGRYDCRCSPQKALPSADLYHHRGHHTIGKVLVDAPALRPVKGGNCARVVLSAARGVVGAARRGRVHLKASVPVHQGIAKCRMCHVKCAQHL